MTGQHAWRLLAAGRLRAGLLVAPVAVPAGLALAGLVWAWRIYAITTGLAGQDRLRPGHVRRPAVAPPGPRRPRPGAAPGAVPLLTRGRPVVVGATIRAVGHRWRPVLSRPGPPRSPGTGHHRLVREREDEPDDAAVGRLVRRRPAPRLRRARRDRPLLVVLDCKGGPDARAKADRTRRLLHGAGARRVAIWPDEARLSPVGPAARATWRCCCCR